MLITVGYIMPNEFLNIPAYNLLMHVRRKNQEGRNGKTISFGNAILSIEYERQELSKQVNALVEDNNKLKTKLSKKWWQTWKK